MKPLQRFVVQLLLFFYLTSSYLSAIHIHANDVEHPSDCKICIVVKDFHVGTAPNLNTSCLTCNCYYEIVSFKNPLINTTILKGFNANAPPSFS
jgi:hypothetical protein